MSLSRHLSRGTITMTVIKPHDGPDIAPIESGKFWYINNLYNTKIYIVAKNCLIMICCVMTTISQTLFNQ